MDFHPVAVDTTKQVLTAIKYILGLEISHSDKKERIKKVLNLVGSDFYMQMFEANSEVFDSTAIGTTDYAEMDDMVGRLATKVERQHYGGRPYDMLVKEFYDTTLGAAQQEAFINAISLGKHPTITRTMVGETCNWCRNLAGTHTYPDGKYFARHDNCDCLIVASGYNSRNGIVKNYKRIVNSPSREAHLAPTLERLRNYDETTAKFADVLEGQNHASLGAITGNAAKALNIKPGTQLLISRNYALHMDNSGHFSGTGYGRNGHDSDYPLSNHQISSIPTIVKSTRAQFVNFRGYSEKNLKRYEIIDGSKQLVVVEISASGQYVDIVDSYTLSNRQYRRKLLGDDR